MTYVIFAIVAAALLGIAHITGLTYNTINILVYYLFIPLSWAWMGDKIIGWRSPWLTIAWGAVWLGVFLCTAGHFQAWCDWAFQKSVDFLMWFRHFKWNYYVASVYICVWLPLAVYCALAWLLISKHPGLHWQPWAVGIGAFFVACWAAWWIAMTFGVKLEPYHQRTGHEYALSADEKAQIHKDTEGLDANEIVKYATKRTCDQLEFQFKPTGAMADGEGNCITYAAVCTAIANEAFRHNGIHAKAVHQVGTLRLWGADLCKFAGRHGGGFFADHDFVTITTDAGAYSIDPSIKDVLGYDLKTRN